MLSQEADVVLVLGSQNSSNSQRLAELARESGVPAYLIDGAADIDLAWFAATTRCWSRPAPARRSWSSRIAWSSCASGSKRTIESRRVRDEEVHFPLPKELRTVPVESGAIRNSFVTGSNSAEPKR